MLQGADFKDINENVTQVCNRYYLLHTSVETLAIKFVYFDFHPLTKT